VFKKILGSLFRHTLTAIGGGAMASGNDASDVIAGAVIAIVGGAMSLHKAKKDKEQEPDIAPARRRE
jgi:hypothetical protein